MARAHMIHGYLGTGKTSFAIELEEAVRGIRFSPDEWYFRLYDAPAHHLEPTWWDSTSALLNEIWPKVLGRGVDVILDFGFWSRRSRDDARERAMKAGADVVLYSLVCPDEVAKARCLRRNAVRGRSFVIDSAAFDALRVKFEPLASDETSTLIDTTPSESG